MVQNLDPVTREPIRVTRHSRPATIVAVICLMVSFPVLAQEEPLRVVVTHVQDRSEADDHLWMRELLANQMRLLLSAGGAEVVDYRHLSAMATEESIKVAGLPGIFADEDANVALPDVTLTGEYRVTADRIEVVFVLSHVDPPEPAAQAHFEGAVGDLDDGMRKLAAELLSRLNRPADSQAHERMTNISLPAHSYARWLGEGRIYAEQGHAPEAWYCAIRALVHTPGDAAARRLRARAFRDMGRYDDAALELAAVVANLKIAPPTRRPVHIDWGDVEVEQRIRWIYWDWTELGELDHELRQILLATQASPQEADRIIADGVSAQAATLYRDFSGGWRGHYEYSGDETHADVDLYEQLIPYSYRLRWAERIARYWAARQRDDQLAVWRENAFEAWQEMRQVMQLHGIAEDRLEASSQAVRTALHEFTPKSITEPAATITYTQATMQTRPSERNRLPRGLPNGLEWSELLPLSWPKEFNVAQVIYNAGDSQLAVGTVRMPPEHRWLGGTLVALAQTIGDNKWTEPRILPPPVNLPGIRSTHPILLKRRNGSYILAWLSNRDAYQTWVYVSRSSNLIHWTPAIRTPAVGKFDMVEASDGSIIIASYNTRITRSRDLVNWSIPQLAVSNYDVQMDGFARPASGDLERSVRLIAADDGRLHLITLVRPGEDPSANVTLLIHAVSDDGHFWRHSLTRQHEPSGSSDDPSREQVPIAAEAIPGGGICMLLRDLESVMKEMPNGPVMRHYSKFEVIRTFDGLGWERVATLNTPFSWFARLRPNWGGLLRMPDGTLQVEFILPNDYGRQTLKLPPSLLRTAGDPVPNREQLVDEWTEDATTRRRCIVVESHTGQSEPEVIADSLGVLLQMDLGHLAGVVPLMAVPLQSGIAFDSADYSSLARPKIRWADDLVQIDVQPVESGWQVGLRVIDVKNAKVALARTYTVLDAQLPEIGRTISREVRALIGTDPADARHAKYLETQYLTDARSLRFLSAAVLYDHPRRTLSGYVVAEWAEAVPDAPLLKVLPYFYTDEPDQRRLAKRLFRAQSIPGVIDSQSGIVPLNPFKLSELPGSVDPVEEREQLLRLIPDCLPLRIHVIEGWLTGGFSERAQPHLDYLATHYADSPEAVAARASALEYMGDQAAAADTWRQFVASWPDDVTPYPYWYGALWDEGKQLFAPPRVRLAMAQAALGQTTEEQIATLRDWYSSFDVATNESADRMLALSFYAYALLRTGDTARLVREIWPALHAPERGPDGIYRFPATVHYINALASEGQTRKARDYLAYLLNEGYWYNSCPKAFHCPQAPALKEQLRRMQVYRPLMGQ